MARSTPLPICIDLDGTLIRSDLLYESLLRLLKRNPFYLLLLPFWLAGGKAHLKQQIARRVELDPALLPYREALLTLLEEKRAQGHRLVLATACDQQLAVGVAEHCGLFDEVLASDGACNLAGPEKARALVERFGERGFVYAGNDETDLKVWRHAAEAWVVSDSPSLQRRARQAAPETRLLDAAGTGAGAALIRAARPHQWLKNLLIFVPLLTAHRFELQSLLSAATAFLAFGLCASSVYLLNDMLDLEADRRHLTKRNRPFASGALALRTGLVVAPLLLLTALALAATLPTTFIAVLAVYYVLTLAYSFLLKQKELVDVLVLATLYTLRILAGAAAVEVRVSFWLLALSMFLFFSLALVKRYTEMLAVSGRGETQAAGRGYRPGDLEGLSQMGAASGYLAVLVLALYINSDDIRRLYAAPEVIWLLCPLLLYIISRVWLLARRDELHEDPVVFVIRDRHSLFAAALGALSFWMAV